MSADSVEMIECCCNAVQIMMKMWELQMHMMSKIKHHLKVEGLPSHSNRGRVIAFSPSYQTYMGHSGARGVEVQSIT